MTLLSILIPSIPSRLGKLQKLYGDLLAQAEGQPVEILSFLDNKKRSIGLKSDALVQVAIGKYCAFVDDDDAVYSNYIADMLTGAREDADVIVFNEHCTINGGTVFTVKFGLEYENEEAHVDNGRWANITRKPWHPCGWRTEIAKSEHFPDASYGEDWHWCKRLVPKAKSQFRIDKVLSRYDYNESVTEAEIVFPKE